MVGRLICAARQRKKRYKHLQKVEVHKGDTYFVPAGTVHGIGKGILVAEIQESSNVTYRVYDYDRVDKNGKKRELHFDKAAQVMNMKVAPDVSQKPRMVKYYSGCSRELLCRCKYFETERIQVTKGFAFSVMDTHSICHFSFWQQVGCIKKNQF